MSLCNYCKYRLDVRRWKKDGKKPKLVSDPLKDERTGKVVFSGGVRVVDKISGKDLGVWYAEMPDHCRC